MLDDDSRFGQTDEHLAVEAFVTQLVMERFDVSVLPCRFRIDVAHLDRSLLHPLLDRIRDELRPVVAADVHRRAVLAHRGLQHAKHICGTNRPRRVPGRSLTRVPVNQGHDAKGVPALDLDTHKVQAPHMIAMPCRLPGLLPRRHTPHPAAAITLMLTAQPHDVIASLLDSVLSFAAR